MSTDTDVIIVGGGPAGSTLGLALQRRGFDVTLIDKASFPRDKVCAGWVTPEVMATLEIDPDDYARERVLQPISAFRTGLVGQRGVETHYGETASYGIRRFEFDEYLLRRSEAAGVRVVQGTPLQSMEREADGRWCVNGEWRAPLLVGAGGHFCPVARQLGTANPGQSETSVTAQEIEFELAPEQQAACPVHPDVPELYFLEDLAGYGWIVRKGNWLNIGLGREGARKLGSEVAGFVDWLKASGRLHVDPPGRFKGHAYGLYGHTPREPVHAGAMLVGDAVALAYPQSGEGIRPAVESALMAADTIAEAGGQYDRAALTPYRDALQARFGPMRGEPGAAPGAVKRALARPLMRSRWFARHMVLDRWFLHRHVPPLHGLTPAAD